jgi:hypothetical protein
MQQRQLRLGDILDDYCPRERRVTNHAVVAMVGHDVKQTRCTTCDAEHEYKHAKVPRQRRKASSPAALYSQVLASGPKRVVHPDAPPDALERHEQDAMAEASPIGAEMNGGDQDGPGLSAVEDLEQSEAMTMPDDSTTPADEASAPLAAMNDDPTLGPLGTDEAPGPERDEGPVHRPLIRASLPRPDGQPPQARPIPEFTIRQPAGRPNRFRRHPRGGQQFQGNRANGNMPGGSPRGMRQGGGRPPLAHTGKRQGHGRKRSK